MPLYIADGQTNKDKVRTTSWNCCQLLEWTLCQTLRCCWFSHDGCGNTWFYQSWLCWRCLAGLQKGRPSSPPAQLCCIWYSWNYTKGRTCPTPSPGSRLMSDSVMLSYWPLKGENWLKQHQLEKADTLVLSLYYSLAHIVLPHKYNSGYTCIALR